MWKDYSLGYIKNNRSSGISVMIAAFISALLLSLLCGLFYNAWKYEVERIELEGGGWQSRIVGELDQEEIESIKNFANVKDVVVNEKEADGKERVIDIYFDDMGAVLEDTPRIAELVGISRESITYNYELLAMYLIRDPQDTAPRLLFPMFILITAMASFSLIVIIHNSFALSMNTRIHQFGIFSSIGATPKQIRACLLQEAAALCTVPILIGNLLGIAGSMLLLRMVNVLLGSSAAGRHEAVFGYHPLVLVLTLFITVLTIWISAWLPARKLSRLTPLEAIKNSGELHLKRRKNSPVLTFLFGMEGELAGNALKAQRKALRTASISLVFSFMAFTVMQCFFSISGISTRETYFERYQGVWDIMVTVKDTGVDSFRETEEIQGLTGVNNAIVYQKAIAKRIITEEEMSEEMKSFGGFSHASGKYVTEAKGGWLVNAPVVILDDASFLAYCEQIGITPQLDGAVIRNQIRDVTNPDFRHPRYMPYVKGKNATSILRQSGNETMMAEVPVLSYTEEVPALREEYAGLDYYEIVHFLPVSLWEKIKGQIGGIEEDTYVCVLGREEVTLEELDHLQKEIDQITAGHYIIESENRIQERMVNDKQIQGSMVISGGFCVLLAIIGIGNVFSNTLGFVRQRKREFARYMSVGMASGEIRKMFCIEALVIAGRPILITLPLAVVAVGYMLRMSYLEAGEFFAEAPLIPIAVFVLAILGTVALAYYLGWRNVRRINLAEVLRDDTMM
ncbi:Macrolide export ATP-binding/permease protein MacB [Blautia producta]|uniref:Macrolide export ATP-binding/permease protein MacB n=1 Tax=Blautia producta TaxID=33035 RepID=A0A4P6LZW2_9FIRM|nr:ABC transporter permease [Blautia producta]QBE97746.1 Macrolide export ATP-binding/permease protein MacB [Blautia producta]